MEDKSAAKKILAPKFKMTSALPANQEKLSKGGLALKIGGYASGGSPEYDERKTVCFTSDQLPQVKDWKVGQKYHIMVEVEQIATKKITDGPDKGCIEGKFAINKVGAEPADKDDE